MGTFALISMLLSLVGMSVSAVMQNSANEQNQQLTEDINKSQQEFSRESAELANEQTRQNYYELYSPQAKVKQYKEAGLSPGLIYSMGGVSGSGQAGAQAAQPSMSVPYINPLIGGNAMSDMTNAIKNAIESDKTKAEESNINKDTDKKEAEIKKLQSDVEVNSETIKKITAETNLTNVRTLNEGFDSQLRQLDIELRTETNKLNIQQMSESIKNLQETTNKIIEETRGAKIENDNKQEIINASLKKLFAETALIWKQKGLVEAETKVAQAREWLTNEQAKLSYVERQKAWSNVFEIENNISRINAEIDLMEKQGEKVDAETINEIIKSFTSVSDAIAKLTPKPKS